MAKSYKIRTQVGVDKQINVQIDQDFDYLEILSLKILQEQIYTRPCSDYGVIVGRLTVNGGYGLPNAKVSVFIPISEQDKLNPIISELYPYEKVTDQNVDGYRYNLLPYIKSYSNHNPTGTFPTREDVLTNPTLIEIYDKYYKYCATTNSAGDFMIFGVPVGTQKLHCDVDLSDIGEFSLSPQDLLRMGLATVTQIAGTSFKSSTNLNELPQIVTINSDVDVSPLWGQPEVCNLGITRVDFDLTKTSKIEITPTSIFMGSVISTGNEDYQKVSCKPTLGQGELCSLIAGPGLIQTIRQTIYLDEFGRPTLETFDLEQGGQVIDENGAFVVDVPMNLDYVVTNEFGEQVLSDNPKRGIPTKGKYRFKIKWIQSADLQEPIKRGVFLIPNIREYWTDPDIDPFSNPDPNPITNPDFALAEKSYSFSLNWDDYPNENVGINCEDYFYEMTYNKVYTVSQFLDSYNRGILLNRKIAIKNILNTECASENNKFPVNDGQFQFDIIYILFTILLFITYIFLNAFLIVWHLLGYLVKIVGQFVGWVLDNIAFVLNKICSFINDTVIGTVNKVLNWLGWNALPSITWCSNAADQLEAWAQAFRDMYKYFENVQIPNLTYPDCQLCDCKVGEKIDEPIDTDPGISVANLVAQQLNARSFLCPVTIPQIYNRLTPQIPSWPPTTLPVLSGNTTTQTPSSMFYNNYIGAVGSQLSGFNALPEEDANAQQRAPQLGNFGINYDYNYYSGQTIEFQRKIFTLSLPISERMNLFNLKSKYFNEGEGSFNGVGINRIKVTFDTDLNSGPNKYHLDNTITLLLNNDQLKKMKPGQLLTFQDPAFSKDPNLTGVTTLNQFGGLSITGTPINVGNLDGSPSKVKIEYANPDGSGNLNVVYDIIQDGGDMYQKFATDMEYFMVITAMTVSDYLELSNPYSKETTLNKRYINNVAKMEVLKTQFGSWDYQGSSGFTVNPITAIKDGQKQGVVFLVRGVDPHSSRTKNRYDLSYLFGFTEDEWGSHPECIVESNDTNNVKYFLNQPIKGGINCVNHLVGNNLNIDSYSGIRLYNESFRFQPSYSGYASFSSYTTNLHTYYSSFDQTFSGTGTSVFKPDNNQSTPLITNAVYVDPDTNTLTPYANAVTNFFTREFTQGVVLSDCYDATAVTVKPDFTNMSVNIPYVLDPFINVSTGSTYGQITSVASVIWNLISEPQTFRNINIASYSCEGANTQIRATVIDQFKNVTQKTLTVSTSDCASYAIGDMKLASFGDFREIGLVTLQPNGVRGGLFRGFNIRFRDFEFNESRSNEVYDIINPLYYTAIPSFTTWDFQPNLGNNYQIIYAYGVPTNTTIPGGIPSNYPVLQQSLRNWPTGETTKVVSANWYNNSEFLQVDTFAINKIKISTEGLLGLIACAYRRSSDDKLFVKIFDASGNERATLGPTGATSNLQITDDVITDYAIDFNPVKSKFLVSWINSSGQIKYNTYSYTFQNLILTVTKNHFLPIEFPHNPNNGTPISLRTKYHDFNYHFTFIYQVNTGYFYYAQYFDDTYVNPSTNFPIIISTQIPTPNTKYPGAPFYFTGSTTPTGTTYFDMDVNGFNNSFSFVFKNNSTGGTATRAFNMNLFLPANRNRGYYQYETLEGGAVMYMNSEATSACGPNNVNPNAPIWNFTGYYYAPTYSKENQLSITLPAPGTTYSGGSNTLFSGLGGGALGGGESQDVINPPQPPVLVTVYPPPVLVMRSDRLPTSTYEDISINNSYPLHTNQFFTCFLLSDSGQAFVLGGMPVTPPSIPAGGDEENLNAVSSLVATTSCNGLVPLGCYTNTNNSFEIKNSSDPCYYNKYGTAANDRILVNGCYVTVTKIWETLINGTDLGILTEWKSRIDINFAACRNVFGHYFRNNWINGTLFAFSIQNDRLFSPVFKNLQRVSPTNPFITPSAYVTEPNTPYSNYCYRTVHLHSVTNEFFYRSSPFYPIDSDSKSKITNGAFVGRNNTNTATNKVNGPVGSNNRFLMFPTTLMDLGPRTNYIQELVMSDEFDGYVAGKLPTSSFNDMIPPLNLFILSRLVSLNATLFFKGVFYYFNRGLYIDGDYAQIAATNTQVGIFPYNESTYNNVTGQTQMPVFLSSNENGYPLLGIFYEGDFEIRDALTPRRTIVNGDVPVSFCSFNDIKTFSQVVPVYQWRLSPDPDDYTKDKSNRYIFGDALNGWYTDTVSLTEDETETIYQYQYQKFDRLSTPSRYFRTNNEDKSSYSKGYIYSVGQDGNQINISANVQTWRKNTTPINNKPQNLVTMGNPFYFYFGLKRGKSSIDLFKRKWVPSNKITK